MLSIKSKRPVVPAFLILLMAWIIPLLVRLISSKGGVYNHPISFLSTIMFTGLLNATPFAILSVLWFKSAKREPVSRAIMANTFALAITLPVMMAIDVYIITAIEFGPQSSTSAVGYIFAPFYCFIACLVVFLIAWLLAYPFIKSPKIVTGVNPTTESIESTIPGSQINIGKAAFFLGLLISVGVGYYQYVSISPPAPGVITKSGFAKKKLFSDSRLSTIEQIQVFSGKDEGRVALMSQSVLLILDSKDFVVKNYMTSKDEKRQYFGSSPRLIGHPSGEFWLLMEGGGYGDVGLYNSSGQLLWVKAYDGPEGAIELKEFGKSPKGYPQFAMLTRKNVQLVDILGKTIGILAPGNYDTMNVTTDGETPKLLLGTRRGNPLMIDFDGKQKPLSSNLEYDAAPIQMGGELFQVLFNNNKIFKISLSGKKQEEYSFNPYPAYHGPQVAVLNNHGGEILGVVVQAPSGESTSCFMAFDPKGNLLHQEVLAKARGIGVLKDPSSNQESFIVGSGNELFMYSPKQ